MKDEFYHRHIVQHDLFSPVFALLRAETINAGDTLVSSAVLEVSVLCMVSSAGLVPPLSTLYSTLATRKDLRFHLCREHQITGLSYSHEASLKEALQTFLRSVSFHHSHGKGSAKGITELGGRRLRTS